MAVKVQLPVSYPPNAIRFGIHDNHKESMKSRRKKRDLRGFKDCLQILCVDVSCWDSVLMGNEGA